MALLFARPICNELRFESYIGACYTLLAKIWSDVMRIKRLYADWEAMKVLAERTACFDIAWNGHVPPEAYQVTFHCRGLFRAPGASQPSISSVHQAAIFLHVTYPRQQPRITWKTEIFHPNILSASRNGGVCIGSWTPAETLPDLCVRLAEMIMYQSYNPHDPLDLEAAAWAVQHADALPVDTRDVLTGFTPAHQSIQQLEVTP